MTREEQLSAALIVAKEYKQGEFAKQLELAIKRMRYTPEDDQLINEIEDLLDATGAVGLGVDELRELAEQIVDLVKSKQKQSEPAPTTYYNLDDIPLRTTVTDKSGDFWYVDANGKFLLRLEGYAYWSRARPEPEEKESFGPYVVVKDEPVPNSSNIKQ